MTPRTKLWIRLVMCYWVLMAVIFFLEFRYMEYGLAGLPGFLLTLPLSVIVVTAVLVPAVVGRYGYEIPWDITGYQAEFGFIICAFLNAFVLYPFYVWWKSRKEPRAFEPPPPPGIELQGAPRKPRY